MSLCCSARRAERGLAVFRLLPALLLLLLCGGCVGAGQEPPATPTVSPAWTQAPALPEPPPEPQRRAVFSWHDAVLYEGQRKALLSVMDRAGADMLYQNLYKQPESLVDPFLADMAAAGIQVYALLGDPSWALPSRLEPMLKQVAIAGQTAARTGNLGGLVLDVEPRQLDEWELDPQGVMAGFVENMCAAYDEAAKAGLRVLVCIPASYDRYPQELERLIAHACDGAALMNYRRGEEYERLRLEADLTKRYNKTLIQISELQAPGVHGLTERNTYYGLGLAALLDAWGELAAQIDHPDLVFAYHDYEMLCGMLGPEPS